MSAKPSRRTRAESKRPRAREAGDESLPEDAASPRTPAFSLGVLKMLLGLVMLLGAAGFVAWGAHHFMTTTTRFAIERVEVEGARRYSDAELLARAGIAADANIFSVDLEAAELKLASDPWIETARIARRLPRTLIFSVTELSAAALASIDGQLYLITRDGQPIKPLAAGDSSDHPVITGIAAEQLGQDRALAQERLALGVSLVEHYSRIGVSKAFPPQGVHLESDGRVSMTVGVPAITLQLGRNSFRQKLLMAGRIVGTLRAKGETPGLVFLDNEAHPERVVVRMR